MARRDPVNTQPEPSSADNPFMPTIGQLFGGWEAEQAALAGTGPTTLGQPEILGPPVQRRAPGTQFAHQTFQVARSLQDPRAMQYALQSVQHALNQLDPLSLEAGELRRIKLELERALRANHLPLVPDSPFTAAEQMPLYRAFGLRRTRMRPEEEDGPGEIEGGD